MFTKSRKRIALIKEMIEVRLKHRGVDSVQARLSVKALGSFSAMSMPEATIVTVLEGIKAAYRRGTPLAHELIRIEKQRYRSGHDGLWFDEILALNHNENPGATFIDFLYYRNQMEAPENGKLTKDEVNFLVEIAVTEIWSWN